MSFLNLNELPFVGMSYQFHGEKQGAPFSAYFVNAKPGQGPPLHTHPYVEVEFTLEGSGTMTVGDETREVNAGSIVVIPANTPHRFVNSGTGVLRQIGIHASPKFIQTNLCHIRVLRRGGWRAGSLRHTAGRIIVGQAHRLP